MVYPPVYWVCRILRLYGCLQRGQEDYNAPVKIFTCMSESPGRHEDSGDSPPPEHGEPPGLPNLVLTYTAGFLAIILFTGIGHAILSLPVFAVTGLVNPEIFYLASFSLTGWAVLYSADVLNVFRFADLEELLKITEEISRSEWLVYAIAVGIYLNTVFSISIVSGYIGTQYGGTFIGFLIALTYPAIDFHLTKRKTSPGTLGLILAIKLLHLFGLLKDVTHEMMLERIRLVPPGSLH